jgi:hypothetical protein
VFKKALSKTKRSTSSGALKSFRVRPLPILLIGLAGFGVGGRAIRVRGNLGEVAKLSRGWSAEALVFSNPHQALFYPLVQRLNMKIDYHV